MQVDSDGSLLVEEHLTFAFDGSFEGAFREVPLREGESIDDVSVAEGETEYRPGASAEIGSTGEPGTFGTTSTGDGLRIVWHYRASSETRTFRVRYRLRGLAVAYDDVVDVNLRVWGDEWGVGLSKLTATLEAPGPVRRAWGHPVHVRGDVELQGERVLLRALDVPRGQWVELRALVPRDAFASAAGMRIEQGAAFDEIVAEEIGAAEAYQRDRERIDRALARPLRTLLLLSLLALLPAGLVLALIWWKFGRELDTGYDREYEQEPPTELAPALVPPLAAQAGRVGSHEFTATLFDLIRRGVFRAAPVATERSVWGGLRSEQIADLELTPGVRDELIPFEDAVADVVDGVLDGGSERLSRFRDRIEDERASQSKRFTRFKKSVAAEIRGRHWYRNTGVLPIVAAALGFVLLGAVLLALGIDERTNVAPSWRSAVLIALAVCSFVNGAVVALSLFNIRFWRRRTRHAQEEAQRWEAFRRYLTDFPRLREAPAASLELWERYLVYGIAFGIAERVLQGAHLHMPPELHEGSSVYWISPSGDLGSGPSALAIGDLSAGFGSALAPPNSGGSGGGGGFSGGGGGGSGGGGGGAW